MKKTKLLLALSIVLVVCGLGWGCSDETPQNTPEIAPQLVEFLGSRYGMSSLESHGISMQNLDLEKSKYEYFKTKDVAMFAIPIVKDGIVVGRMNAFITNGDNPYRAVVESWENNGSGYSVKLTTGNGFYLATVEVHEDSGKGQKLVDVVNMNDLQSRSNRPNNESWAECLARIYDEADKACSGDPNCNFLCDLIDIVVAECTVSMMVAAAIVCI